MSAVRASYRNPRREYFFRNINRFKFNKLVEKTLKGSIYSRLKNKGYIYMKKLGIR